MDTYQMISGVKIALGYWRCNCAVANIHHSGSELGSTKCGACGCERFQNDAVPAAEVEALIELGK